MFEEIDWGRGDATPVSKPRTPMRPSHSATTEFTIIYPGKKSSQVQVRVNERVERSVMAYLHHAEVLGWILLGSPSRITTQKMCGLPQIVH